MADDAPVNSQTTSAPRSAPSKSTQPSEAEIRDRAYEIFQRRGARHGRDLEDWELAIRELRAERNIGTHTLASHSPQPKTSPLSDTVLACRSEQLEPAIAKTSRKR
jgi:hypothetical protein